MPEVTHSREDHRETGSIGRCDHFVVPDRAARLDDSRSARFHGSQQTVGERKEGVRRDRRADGARCVPAISLRGFLRLRGGDPRRVSRRFPAGAQGGERRLVDLVAAAAIRALSRRFIWPAPMPAVTPSRA